VKVLLVDPSDRGGIAVHTELVARELAAAGAPPELLANRALPEARTDYPVRRWLPGVHWGDAPRRGPSLYARELVRWSASAAAVELAARLRRPQVIDFQAPLHRRLDARLVRHLLRVAPVAWTIHDVVPPGDRTERNRLRSAAIYRSATLLIVHSEVARRQVVELAGVEPVVMSLAVPGGGESIARDEARRRLGIPEEGRLFGALGFVRPYKGYDLLADVWERLGPDAPGLLVMGEVVGEGQEAVLERLRRTGKVIVRLGYASEADLHLAFCASDAVLLPYVEASESALLAGARKLGIPVIASDVPELAASVRASGAGSVVPREVEAWSAAVTGELPPAPEPRRPASAGNERLVAYEEARRRWEHGSKASPARHRPPRGAAGAVTRLVAYTDSTEFAGAETSLATLLGGLRPEIEVTVLGCDPRVVERLASARPGARGELVPGVRDKRDLRAIRAHLRTVRRLRPDIFHANLRIPWSCQYGIAAALLARGVRVVAVEQLFTPPFSRSQRRFKKLASLRLDAHVAVGERLARQIEAEVGLPDGFIRTIHNTVADVHEDPLPRPVDGPIVGTVARLAPEKGLDVLVGALPDLPGVTAVLVGAGPERERLEALAAEAGVSDRVLITGWVSNARARLEWFDVFALPSRYEGLPHAILEAMLAKRPVVASDVGSVREIVIDGVTGILVPPDDGKALSEAIARLLENSELARRLGEAGRELALERFRPEGMVAAYESLYDEVLS
jgi:glycosyltransferase involved in cell wall biosynthesis